MSKYTHNIEFFKEPGLINSYWAGFIAADGGIIKDKHLIYISLAQKDKQHLEQFVKDIEYTGHVRDRQYGPTDKYRARKYCELTINGCKNDIYYLNQHWNVIQKKSLVLKPPNIKNMQLSLAYILGYIDGDGCIQISRNQPQIQIIGTETVLSWIQNTINLVINKQFKSKLVKRGKVYQIAYYGKDSSMLFKKLIEFGLDKLPILSRKWDKLRLTTKIANR